MKSLLALAVLAGCQVSAPMTPKAAEESTYELFVDGGQCTGWAVTEHNMMTAGHCCADAKKLTARSADGVQFQVSIVDYELTELNWDQQEKLKDACLLKSDRPLHPVTLASEMPAVGTEAWFVGYPLGHFVKSVGVYIGDQDGVQIWDDYVVTAPCDHGASGSAFFTEAGVFGILVRSVVFGTDIRPGDEGCVATPLADIKALLSKNGIAVE